MERDDDPRLTLAQLARRVGISEGRARALSTGGATARPGLPTPDGHDVDGRPWWSSWTIDRWCVDTGRAVPADAHWPYNWPKASAPMPVTFNDMVEVPVRGRIQGPIRAHVLVWDTPQGHVALVQELDDETTDEKNLARAAAHALQPAFWSAAVVLVPQYAGFGGSHPEYTEVYRLRAAQGEGADEAGEGSAADERSVSPDAPRPAVPRRLPRFVKAILAGQVAPTEAEAASQPWPWGPLPAADPGTVTVVPAGLADFGHVSDVLGQRVPIWLSGTCTPVGIERMRAYGTATEETFTIPDTLTPWPGHLDLAAAAAAGDGQGDADTGGMAQRFPQAFTVLAQETLGVLQEVESDHQGTLDRGDGLYLVARPARPTWPVPLEQCIREAAARPIELDAAADELTALRTTEQDLPWDSDAAEAMFEACRGLSGHLLRSHPDIVFATAVRHCTKLVGPVNGQYMTTLTPLDPDQVQAWKAAPTRRLVRLLVGTTMSRASIRETGTLSRSLDQLRQLHLDPRGRLVAELDGGDGYGTYLYIEWPTDLPSTWTARTVIAADPDRLTAFALTPAEDGTMQVDPLPNPGDDPGYTWGYRGTGPRTLYQALVRCALRTWPEAGEVDWRRGLRSGGTSLLWHTITTTPHDAPIRLRWPQIQQWAVDDLAKFGKLNGPA